MKLKDFLLPTPANDHSPHILQKMAIIGMAGLILLSFVAVNLQSLLWQSSDWLVGAVLPATVVDLTNKERSDLTLSSLNRNPLLDEAAKLKAEDMAKKHYFSHYSPDNVSPWYWFNQVNYDYLHAGENLAIYFTDSEAIVNAWMNSPSHRANIVDQKYTEIGVGTAKGIYNGYKTVYVVQLFGTPKTMVKSNEVPVKFMDTSEMLASVATKPNQILQSIYLLLGLSVALLVVISMLLGFRFHRSRQVVYGTTLLLLMSGLFYVHISLTSEVVLASESWITTDTDLNFNE